MAVNCFITDLGCGNTVDIHEDENGDFYAECSNCLLNAGRRRNSGLANAAYATINTQNRPIANFRAAQVSNEIVITDE